MPVSQVPFAGISNPVDFRNIVINGDMQIAQRATSVTSKTTDGYYTCDRWNNSINLGTWSIAQSTDVPTGQGFANSFKMTCTTGASLAAGTQNYLNQRFEGQNLQYLKKGTANASPLTASFWCKSATTTGTMIVELFDTDNTRQISKQISVTSSWTKYTITYAGDTTGTLNNDNGASLYLIFWVSAGSNFTSGTLNTSWAASTNSNRAVGQTNFAVTNTEIYITGVQLEAGEQASEFEFMPIDANLLRCQRYYYLHSKRSGNFEPIGTGFYDSGTVLACNIKFTPNMRSDPTLVSGSGTNYYRFDRNGGSDEVNSFSLSMSYQTNATIFNNSEASGTGGQAGNLYLNNDSAYIAFESEL